MLLGSKFGMTTASSDEPDLVLDYSNATSRIQITQADVGDAKDIRIILPENAPVDYFLQNAFNTDLTGLQKIRIAGIKNLNGYSNRARALNGMGISNAGPALNVIFEGMTDLGFSSDFSGSRSGASYWCAGGFDPSITGESIEIHFPDVTRIDFNGASTTNIQNFIRPKPFYDKNMKFDMYFHKDLTYIVFSNILAHTSGNALPAGQQLCIIHFTSGSRSVVESSANYNTKWNTANVIIAYDA